MKILSIIALTTSLLSFSNYDVNISEVQTHIDEIQPTMEAALLDQLDSAEFTAEINDFNQYLSQLSASTDDSRIDEYVTIQKKANNARMIAVSTSDTDGITESARIQYEAFTLYEEIMKDNEN